eukprot:g46745.t1
MNAIYKFANDTTILGWISNNDKLKYRREIEGFVTWCNENNLSLNISKIKELIANFSKAGGEHASIYINGTEVERLKSIKFRRPDLDCSYKCYSQEGTTMPLLPQASITSFTNFYRCTIESKLSRCITACCGNCSAQDCKKLQKVVCTAQAI